VSVQCINRAAAPLHAQLGWSADHHEATVSIGADSMSAPGMSVPVVSVAGVKQVVTVRMLPTREQAAALQATLSTCNEAASWLSAGMHSEQVHRKYDAQKRFYIELKRRFGLSAQPAIRVIGKVADSYAALRANIEAGNYGPPGSPKRKKVAATPIGFRPEAAQPFDARCLSWQIPDVVGTREATVSIWTTHGRCKGVPVLALPHDLALLRTRPIGETDLIRRDGKWFLHATIEAPEVPRTDPRNGFLGVDLGIVNIATSSEGNRAAGARLNRYRKRQQRLRARLQTKKTSSARRLLKKRRRKEARFAADVNHRISKRIVAEAQRTGRGIAVEQLGGIRARVRLRKPQRAAMHSWGFAQLGAFLAYKAKQAGVAFVEVDPAYTSQTCSGCGWVDKRNRRSQSEFECGRCGFVGHADHNAAINIARRGVERWGEVMRPNAAPTLTAS
jgi:putative transposase